MYIGGNNMADITMCTYKECPKAKSCYRQLAYADQHQQAYGDFSFYYNHDTNRCEYFYNAFNNKR